MIDGRAPRTPSLRVGAVLLLLLGVGQLGLITAAFARVIDPEPTTFAAVGTLAGLGVVVGVVATAWTARAPKLRILMFASGAATLAGFAYATVWGSLLGATFFLDDTPRISVLVASDLVVAGWFLMAAGSMEPRRPPVPRVIGVVLLIRAIVEARYLVGILSPAPPNYPGSSSGLEGIFVGVLVLGGIVVLAFWELALGRWMLGMTRPRAIA